MFIFLCYIPDLESGIGSTPESFGKTSFALAVTFQVEDADGSRTDVLALGDDGKWALVLVLDGRRFQPPPLSA
jgi:hypothetical protein